MGKGTNYAWTKRFGIFEMRIRDCMTVGASFYCTIYCKRKKWTYLIVDDVRGFTLKDARTKGLTRLRQIFQDAEQDIKSYTVADSPPKEK